MTEHQRRLFLASTLASTWSLMCPLAIAGAKQKDRSKIEPVVSRKIVVGQSVPLSGAVANIGLAYSAGSKAYFDAFNARGHSSLVFEQVTLDDGYQPHISMGNARRLIGEKADLLFGFLGTSCCTGAAKIARENGKLLFAPFAASSLLRSPANAHVFHIRPSMSDEASKMLQQSHAMGLTRIAVLAEEGDMGQEGLDAVDAAIKALQLPPIVGSARVQTDSGQADAAVARLLGLQPQVIILVSHYMSSAAFTRKARRSGYGGALMNFSVVGLDQLHAALGRDFAGVTVAQVVPSTRNIALPLVREYAAVSKRNNTLPTSVGLEGFIAAKTLVEGVLRAGSGFDAVELQKSLETVRGFDLGGYRVNLHASEPTPQQNIDLVTISATGQLLR
ncbi:MAG: ABC transporter substrate-binding protein [Burkholderiales bacterium]